MTADSTNPWRLVRRETRFACPYFDVQQDTVSHSGRKPRPYNSVRMRFLGVAAAAIDQKGQVILVGQYRYVLDRYTWEIPGGAAAVDEDPLRAAKVELEEETGCRARRWVKIVEGAASPGTTDEVASCYLAWDLEEGKPQPEPEEQLALRRVPFAEAVEMALRGEIGNMVGVALLLGIQARMTQGDLPGDVLALLTAG